MKRVTEPERLARLRAGCCQCILDRPPYDIILFWLATVPPCPCGV